jgi:WD40 repeat protein
MADSDPKEDKVVVEGEEVESSMDGAYLAEGEGVVVEDDGDVFEPEEDGEDESEAADEEGEEEVPLASSLREFLLGDAVYAVATHPTAPIVAAGHGDDGVVAWDVETGEELLRANKCHKDSVTCVRFSADGTMLASASLDGTMRVWRVSRAEPSSAAAASASTESSSVKSAWRVGGVAPKTSGKKGGSKGGLGPMVLEGPSADVEWMEWHPSGPALLCGSADCTAWVFDASTGDCLSVLAGHEGAVTAGMFDSKGKRAITASDDGTVRVWAPASGECKMTVRGAGWFEPGEPIVALACHPTRPLVLAGGIDGTARLANLSNGKHLATFFHENSVAKSKEEAIAAADAAEEAMIAAAMSGQDPEAASASSAVEEEDGEIRETTSSVEGVGFCPLEHLQLAATGSTDGGLRIWDLSSFSVRAAARQEGSIVRLVWHPREPVVLTCASDGTIRGFDARDCSTLLVLPAHSAMCLDISLALWPKPTEGKEEGHSIIPYGELLVFSGGDDHRAALFEVGI